MKFLSQRNFDSIRRLKNKASELEFIIFKPSGNDTGLFLEMVKDPKQRKIIAEQLQKKHRNVEQVGFVNLDPKHAELQMAGNEFCGNATSSAAYHILKGKPGKIPIKVSGVKKKLIAGVTHAGEGFSQMPIYSDPSYIEPDATNPGNAIVNMEGITHYIDFNTAQIKGLTAEEIKLKARRQMRKLGIDQSVCCGIIYAERRNNTWAIYPVVYIRDVNTLYYETACGSGTTALGLVLAKRTGTSIQEMSVIQPTGLTIKISVEFNGVSFGYAQIQSFIEKLAGGVLVTEQASLGKQHLPALSLFDNNNIIFQTISKFLAYSKTPRNQLSEVIR